MTGITPHNILRHELIGTNVRIVKSNDPTLKGVQGTIMDETRNMITVQRRDKQIRVPKGVAVFRFKLRSGLVVDVEGYRLVGRPENRLKTRVRRW